MLLVAVMWQPGDLDSMAHRNNCKLLFLLGKIMNWIQELTLVHRAPMFLTVMVTCRLQFI